MTDPLREQRARLLSALIGVIGASDPDQLRIMAAMTRAADLPPDQKASMLFAIEVLLDALLNPA